MRQRRVKKRKANRASGGTITGQRALAKALGCSDSGANKYVNDYRWKWGHGPWKPSDLGAMKRWREDHFPTPEEKREGRVAGGDDGEEEDLTRMPAEKRAKLHLLIERAAKLKVEREMLLGGFLKKQEVDHRWTEQVIAVRQELSNIRLLAVKMAAKNWITQEIVPQVEAFFEDYAKSVCRKFAGQSE